MKRILIIISGSIAAYKIFEIISLLKKNNNDIKCVLTRSAENLISETSLSILTENKVFKYDHIYDKNENLDHIKLSRQSDLILILPATGNIISKIANGIADDLATSIIIANNNVPVIIFPAMNPMIWHNYAIQENIKKLKNFINIEIINPVYGNTVCNEKGIGRLESNENIINIINSYTIKNKKKIIITSGATKEYIDDVRFISNNSSGKQGNIIAQILAISGHSISLITSSNIEEYYHKKIDVHRVETGLEMFNKVKQVMEESEFNVAICVAAVCDWKIKKYKDKIDKKSIKEINLDLNEDILHYIATKKNNRPETVIGFSAESNNLEKKAIEKIIKKKCDYIIANDISNNGSFGKNESNIAIVDKNKKLIKRGLFSKRYIADFINKKLIK